jgi:hypothetical protein
MFQEEKMSHAKSLLLIVAMLLILTACNFPQGINQPSDTSDTQPTDTKTPSQPTATEVQIIGPSYPIKLKISTTSDWTTVRLTGGGIWHEFTIDSADTEAGLANFEDGQLILDQPLSRAESGYTVDMEASGLISNLDPAAPILVEIDRGHIGATQVEIYRTLEDSPSQVTTLNYAGISGSADNSQVYEVSPQPFIGSPPNEYIVIAQLNFWYYGDGQWGGFENPDGSRMTPVIPLLGETYYAADPEVVYQQIEWAVHYGVDAFSIEWTTPRGVGCCGSMEDTLDDVFLISPNIHKVRWAIFYDFILRLGQTPELGDPFPNFDLPEVYDTFVDDFVHFAEKYFGHPQYLTIDGRPVIYIWATNGFAGNFSGAMREARQRVAELGYDVFIVGDEVCYGCFRRAHAALFDGSSTFTFLMPGIDIFALDDVGEAAVITDQVFTWWRGKINGLRVTGRDDLVNFQPAWAPQYDESYINDRPNPIYVPATSIDQVIEMATVARKHAEPTGSQDMRLIWVNTWNCWGETTTVEPTVELGPKYPAGNYHFDMLEVIRDIFGVETYYTAPVP